MEVRPQKNSHVRKRWIVQADSRQFARILAYCALARNAEAKSELAEYEKKHAGDDAYGVAQIYNFCGDINGSFKWLDRAYANRDSQLVYIQSDPFFKNLRSDTRYTGVLRKINLPL